MPSPVGSTWTSPLVPALNAGTDPASGGGSDRALNYYYIFGGGNLGTGNPPPDGGVIPATTGATTNLGGTAKSLTATKAVANQPGPSTPNDENPPQFEAYLDMTNELQHPNFSQSADPSMTGTPNGPGTGYYWVYLRRPLNPFDDTYYPSNPNYNRVVVDSFRFFYNASNGKISTSTSGGTTTTTATQNNEYIYSIDRAQPFRGGQMISQFPVAPITANTMQVASYGYSEQTNNTFPKSGSYNQKTPGTIKPPPKTGPTTYQEYFGLNQAAMAPNNRITMAIGDNLGVNPRAIDSDNKWNWLVFNDRDFTSVAELMLVPGCPPGLLTKQFIEAAPNSRVLSNSYWAKVYTNWVTVYGQRPPTADDNPQAANATGTGTPNGGGMYPPGTGGFPNGPPFLPISFDANNPQVDRTTFAISAPAQVPVPHTAPYLVDNFFYTGATEFVYPPATFPHTTPVPSTDNPQLPPYVGGPSGAGWHKMFEFFEVPSPVISATGMVAQGNNFDWFRQDRRPGLLNLNLIIDEEVFLGLMGFDSSDSFQQTVLNSPLQNALTGTSYKANQTRMQLNLTPIIPSNPPQATDLPVIVTQLDALGNPSKWYQIPNNGAFVVTNAVNNGDGSSYIKACFADFLRLRSGGSELNDLNGLTGGLNCLYGLSNPNAGTPAVSLQTAPVPFDRPFHALSYPDIDYTVMRPAVLAPNALTTGPAPAGGIWPIPTGGTAGAPTWPYYNGNAVAPMNTTYTQDPGVKNPYLAANSLPVQPPPIMPPPIPTRRLFQVPDAYGSPLPPSLVPLVDPNAPNSATVQSMNTNMKYIFNPGTNAPPTSPSLPMYNGFTAYDAPASNASVPGDPNINTPQFKGNVLFGDKALANYMFDLTPFRIANPQPTTSVTASNLNIYGLGPVWLGNHTGLNSSVASSLTPPVWSGISDGNNVINGQVLPAAPFQQADMRQQPFFRTEWMQRVMNLTTVRTHQFAVWITIGLFEVTATGDPQQAQTNPQAAYDQLGPELGSLEGSSTRYHGFFVLDRTRATGFNPAVPGDFRDVIVYRKIIE
jgi:hypothetical protein